jgi:hypothetical protein
MWEGKLTNLDTAYLNISTVNSSMIYNVATGFCLTHEFGVAACNDRMRQGFILVNNQIAIPSGNQVECTAYLHVSTEYFNFVKARCGQTVNFRWDGQSLHIVGIAVKPTGASTGCLSTDNGDTARIFFKACGDYMIQKSGYSVRQVRMCHQKEAEAPLYSFNIISLWNIRLWYTIIY